LYERPDTTSATIRDRQGCSTWLNGSLYTIREIAAKIDFTPARRLPVGAPISGHRVVLDRGASVSVSDTHSGVFYENAVRGIRDDNSPRIQAGGPAVETETPCLALSEMTPPTTLTVPLNTCTPSRV
jgi:hypothetical protein